MSTYLVDYDIGGTKTECALLELSDQSRPHSYKIEVPGRGRRFISVLLRERVPTEREKGYDHILGRIQSLWEKVESAVPDRAAISSVGIGLPGTVHPRTGRMLNGNTNAFVGHDLQSDFEDIFLDVERVMSANDANCFALAEVHCGVGLKYQAETNVPPNEQIAVGVILGTGCGAGLVINGKMVVGKNGGAGEMGHSLLVSDGRPCFCGRKGCAEVYISGTGLELTYSEASARPLGSFTATDVFRWESQGEPEARRAVMDYCGKLATFLANMTNVVDPDYFVLGGGVSQQPLIYRGLSESIKGDLFLPVPPPQIYQHTLGDSAGVIGAALLPILS